MSTFGRQQILTVGHGIKVSGSDATYQDGVVVAVGEKALRYGQVVTLITASGKYGPYDPGASDGRQTLVQGAAFIVHETVKENDLHSDHPPVLYGGLVWLSRILQSGVAAHTLALGPTLAELKAAFPRLAYVTESPQ